jgi:hypothetical protein
MPLLRLAYTLLFVDRTSCVAVRRCHPCVYCARCCLRCLMQWCVPVGRGHTGTGLWYCLQQLYVLFATMYLYLYIYAFPLCIIDSILVYCLILNVTCVEYYCAPVTIWTIWLFSISCITVILIVLLWLRYDPHSLPAVPVLCYVYYCARLRLRLVMPCGGGDITICYTTKFCHCWFG